MTGLKRHSEIFRFFLVFRGSTLTKKKMWEKCKRKAARRMLCRRRWRAQRKSNRKRNMLNTSECDVMRLLDSRVADMWTRWNLSVSACANANDSSKNVTKKKSNSCVERPPLSGRARVVFFHFAVESYAILTKSFRNHNQWSIFMQFTFPQKRTILGTIMKHDAIC